MNSHLQRIFDFIKQSAYLSAEDKATLEKAVKDTDKELEILTFKLDRTEKVKHTTAILLEETIEELEHKRKAVEAQNWELEIESSLERVRTVAMSMNKPDDMLEVCTTISLQLQSLGVKEIRNVQTAIFYEARGTYMNYEYYAKHQKTFITETYYTDHEIGKTFAARMLKGKGEISFTFLKDEEKVKEWLAYQKTTNVFIDTFLETASSLSYYWFSLGPVALGISTYVPLRDDELSLFKRFLNVFELAYRRFLDIEKAVAQAKEAKIEVSLERVRSRAMAMQNSGELGDLVATVFAELTKLDFAITSSIIWIHNPELNTEELWAASPELNKPARPIQLKSFYHPFFKSIIHAWKNLDQKWIYELTGVDKQNFEELFFHDVGNLPEALKTALTAHEKVIFSASFSRFGAIEVLGVDALSDDKFEILHRIGRVFDLSYTRFNDLKQAEMQAREAQIELALERVRARTMAMQRSEELSETAHILFQQFTELGESPLQITIGIVHEEEGVIEFRVTDWSGGGLQVNRGFNAGIDEPTLIRKMYTAWKEQQKSLVVDLSGKELEDWINYRNKISGVSVSSLDTKGRRVITSAFFSKGHLSFSTAEPRPPETVKILERFAGVFDQTYTRFLDLQKAEAQAREARIEAALEKVRAVAMSMHASEDLLNVCEVLYQQLQSLGISNIRNAIIDIYDDEKKRKLNYDYSVEMGKTISPIPYDVHPLIARQIEEIRSAEDAFSETVFTGQELENWKEFRRKSGQKDDPRVTSTSSLHYHLYSIGKGSIGISTFGNIDANKLELLKRFRNVFSLSYQRYIDIVQAEAQAREAQIEAGLERVRSRTMGMQKSEELKEVIQVVFEQFVHLNIHIEHTGFIMDYTARDDMHIWLADQREVPAEVTIPYFDCAHWNSFNEAKEKGLDFFTNHLTFEEKNKFYQDLFKLIPGVPEETLDYYFSCPGLAISTVLLENVGLYIENFSGIPYSDEENATLMRFGKVFQQTYTRFLDLQKAEAQAREAQIEASLERVRSKAMAMQRSEDLANAVAIVFEELDKLNIGMLRCGIGILDHDKPRGDIWITVKSELGNKIQVSGDEPLDIHPLLENAYGAWLKQEDSSYVLEGEDLVHYYQALTKTNFQLPVSATFHPDVNDQKHYYFSAAFQHGALFAFMKEAITDETKMVMKRFANVFDLTYKRFLDLQKAESQAREAQIETGLERVRSKAMAMHSSEDLAITVDSFFIELKSLHVIPRRCGVSLIDGETHIAAITATTATQDGESKKVFGKLKLVGHPVLIGAYDHWRLQKEFHPVLRGVEIKEYYEVMNPQVSFPDFTEDAIQYGHYFFFKEGCVFTWTDVELSEEDLQIFRKFTSVLSLTYRRYLDLIEAETQAREATIDAALEKVRGRAMAMHNSSDLSSTASMVFTELRKLGIVPIRSGVALLTKENRKATIYAATSAEEGDALSLVGWVLLDGQPVLKAQYDSWLRQEDFFPSLKGKELMDYYEKLTPNFSVPDIQTDVEQHGYYLPFRDGFLYCWTENPYTETQIKILNRFKAIIDLTFRRYMELQKSEANAREAVRQASLDRVRAEIASMRTMHDLEKITPLIWNELTILGVPFIRCGVFIMDETVQLIHTFLSTPEGKAIAAFHLPYSSPGNIAQVLTHWKSNENYINHWDEAAFKEFAGILVKEGALTSPEQYLSTMPRGGFYLHFLPFLQGMLYVGNTVQLKEDEIQVIQSVAYAFSTAYARYEDFNKLEAAKQQVDNTLSELKQAQQQLIQSEKMASLGELTAGIAHEIQNPLNFVNNFSEVNTELIEEMKQEIVKENLKEVISIANDIKDNQEKITHHGKRADAIVKGMLQHSRTSSGVKEPTDINALADEYLRLAYHGLRAKDKSFNATMKTDFDESIGLINIIPQDIGRVILNLITNAFYAVNEKKQELTNTPHPLKGGVAFEPTVLVLTKKQLPLSGGGGLDGATVVISVKDNGNGIPQKVLDKIFQPFFTTKPTGQGTGLGLSLSYDIVKAQGGEINVETKEGEGTQFIITIPV